MKLLIPFIFAITTQINTTAIDEENITIEKVEIDQYGLQTIDSAFIDLNRLENLMNNLEATIYKKPKNAKFNADGVIVPEEPGITLDRTEFKKLFKALYYSENREDLKVPTTDVYPEVDTGLLREISEKQLGSYVTNYRESNKERSNNIALAAEAINNTVIFPGDTFSFNKVVGERTTERGYERAPVIVKGELSEDIGGGICQVSSTLFNAVDLKGIQIVERYAHSRRVPYVPPGRDATVSWWGPDFVFKNLYNEPILIRAKSQYGQMIVTVYSKDTVEFFNGS